MKLDLCSDNYQNNIREHTISHLSKMDLSSYMETSSELPLILHYDELIVVW